MTDGAGLLADVEAFVSRFVAWSSPHYGAAHAAWVAHTHLMDAWDATPRAAVLSPEPSSGKSRVLEVTATLVPRPVHAVNTTPAYLFRKVSDPEGLPTILYDEIDTVFGPKAKENEEVRGMLNAGWRKGAVAGRARQDGTTEELEAYAPVMLAGLGSLPDTVMTRSVVIRMRRRHRDERVESWRIRRHEAEGSELRERLAAWADEVRDKAAVTWPEMPEGVEDRAADIWEPLMVVAVLAGGVWPSRIGVAAVAGVAGQQGEDVSLGVRLLGDLREVFKGQDRLSSLDVIGALVRDETAPWSSIKGEPISTGLLARLLKPYGIAPKQMRFGERNVRGYEAMDFHDAWDRYLKGEDEEGENDGQAVSSPLSLSSQKPATAATPATTAPSSCWKCGEPLTRAGAWCDNRGHADHGQMYDAMRLVVSEFGAVDVTDQVDGGPR